MAPQPVVTGLSPKEGPPGTKVTIRGEFLGLKPNDLIGMFLFFGFNKNYFINNIRSVFLLFWKNTTIDSIDGFYFIIKNKLPYKKLQYESLFK